MKKKIIYFGYNGNKYLDDSIEVRFPYEGEYIDVVTINNRNYLFTKGTTDIKKGIIDVREIIQTIYSDGNFITYANSYKSRECEVMENFFNRSDIKLKVDAGISLSLILNEINLKNSKPKIKSLNDDNFTMITIIREDVFEEARAALIKNINKSFVELAMENIRLTSERQK